jgi:D-tyrosyl-tRNA(Tyr) deacylase
MIGLIQRVTEARVRVAGELLAEIGPGILAFVGVGRDDTPRDAARLAERLLSYRIFADAQGRMNRDVREARGALLLVPQFTLVADTHKGNRPSFSRAAPPALGQRLFDALVADCRAAHPDVATGRFGAEMQVALVNDGPVTFWLEVAGA